MATRAEGTTVPGTTAEPKQAQLKKTPAKKAEARKTTKTETMVTIMQIGSPIGRPSGQRQTLIGLKLNKIGRRASLEDTPAVRGMIAKVDHLVRIVDEGGSR